MRSCINYRRGDEQPAVSMRGSDLENYVCTYYGRCTIPEALLPADRLQPYFDLRQYHAEVRFLFQVPASHWWHPSARPGVFIRSAASSTLVTALGAVCKLFFNLEAILYSVAAKINGGKVPDLVGSPAVPSNSSQTPSLSVDLSKAMCMPSMADRALVTLGADMLVLLIAM